MNPSPEMDPSDQPVADRHVVDRPDVVPPIADHWRRFRRLMVVMTIAAFATAGIAVWRMRADGVPFHLHFIIAMGGGIVIALLLAGVLMGLAFVSNRSGHDAAVSEIDD